MIRTVEKGKTLLVDGPASVAVASGTVEVFGARLSSASKVVIREGKRLPFAVIEKATFEIQLAEKANLEEADGNTIPLSWAQALEETLNLQRKPATLMVLGSADSGKTSLCTYIVNRALLQKRKTAILDGDLGQSDIGPPCTVAYTFVTKPITDLFDLRAKNAVFIGTTSPNCATEKVIESLASLKKEILANNPDLIIVNSDGWTQGEEAVKYKVQLVEEISPDIIVYIQQKDELTPLMRSLERFRGVVVDSPSLICLRNREIRKNLRELGYIKYLRNAKMQSFPLGWLKVEGSELLDLNRTRPSMKEASRIYDLLGMKPLHLAERDDRVTIIIGKRRWISAENLRKIEEILRKKVVLIRKGEEEGLITSLCDAERKFLGIGILKEIDYLRKTIKISTSVPSDIAVATIGKVKLDKNMKETPAFEEENPPDFTRFSKLF